jgi:dTMP kinase
MAYRGRLIAIEGIDGAGKRTQAKLLAGALQDRGIPLLRLSFPRYESSFGRLIGRFLNGEFGGPDAVDPHLAALLYAGDRLEARAGMEAALAGGKTILADRYIASNLAHQTARVAPEQRLEFLAWLRHVEYDIYGLPAEDVVIYLRLAAVTAQRLVGRKAPRRYTALQHDLLEADLEHLEGAARVYDQLAASSGWITIECLDAAADLRPPEQIHRAILAALEPHLLPRPAAP